MTYGLITTLIGPEKIDKPNRTRLVAGGDRVHYPGDAGTPTTDLLTVKLLINSIISTAGAKFMMMNIKDFYLNNPMVRYKYMRLRITNMPEDIIEHYNLATRPPPMATYTARYIRGCTAYHRLVSLPNNYSKNASKSMDIVKAKQPPVSGNMTPAPSAYPVLSKILR